QSLVRISLDHLILVFFFSSRRRHTSSKRDWSSDVCSSALVRPRAAVRREPCPRRGVGQAPCAGQGLGWQGRGWSSQSSPKRAMKIGRASCRERVKIWVEEVAVRLKEKTIRRSGITRGEVGT